jgi:peptide-methionine (R)-S-oxide reductase
MSLFAFSEKEPGVDRRAFLFTVATGATTVLTACRVAADEQVVHKAGDQQFEIMKTENQWKQALTKEQFQVLRKHATERPGSSPLNGEHRTGTYHCAGCDLPVYSSATKFESGTGWPSFTAALANGVGTTVDRSFFATRTEVHCRRCGGHLGHVFDDGPEPTGKRYCMNGAALIFKPASQGA